MTTGPHVPKRRWTDQQLREAIQTCTTWAAVQRQLGLRGPSDAIRTRCDGLGLDHRHIGTPASRRRWTDEQLVAAVAASTNMRQVFLALGLAVGGGTWMSMQDHIRRLRLDTSHWDRPLPKTHVPRARVTFEWRDQQILDASAGARSIAQVMERLGLDPKRKLGRGVIERRMREVGVDPLSLPGQGWARDTTVRPRYRKPLAEILVDGKAITSTYALKRRLVAEGHFEWRCSRCDVVDWRGEPLALQLDHVNGDRRDNRLENLRLLCPNCHSQTDTFAGRNAGRRYSSPRE